MTHNELLEMVKFRLECAELKYLQEEAPAVRALLSVVELHNPWHTDKFGEPVDVCRGCFEVTDDHIKYPCPTIRAIEKELVDEH
jgi:hypothetical protein